MKLQRAIEKIASVHRTDWISAQSADVSKKLAEDLEAHGFVQLRHEQSGMRRSLLVRLTDKGRDELMTSEVDSSPSNVAEERRSPMATPAPGIPASETPDAAVRRVVYEIVSTIRNGDLETAVPVEMRSAYALADAIARRWPRR